ncbi:glycine betaine ABC transporter substrate-binding protein [Legionella saoudiensis]|uniref:glycine betaine ABC transporter substrate-binding protein n=1 Tax=Legionella saoudiensis TaxID=1750561 RepID=UPI00073119C2|nr:glycine betaine ABC transporter substrate-binding protein [Legionella saoudiensis]
MDNYWDLIKTHLPELYTKLIEHVSISLSALLLATGIGISLGLLINHLPKLRTPILTLTNISQTIPSIALLGFLIPFVGIGLTPTLIVLIIYALLPITSTTYTGLKEVPANYLHVADSMGFTRWQRLYLIELPLALPVIMTGIRTSMAMVIGITTIAAFIGAGGLGDFITQGLSLNDPTLILLGAIPVALLALSVDYVIGTLSVLLSGRRRLTLCFKKTKLILVSLIMGILFFMAAQPLISSCLPKNVLIIGSKDFTEQYLLGHLMAEILEAKTDLHVVKKFNLGTTAILHNALLAGQIDLYPEYTGTAYHVVLKKNEPLNSQQLYNYISSVYKKNYDLIWLPPFGFENSETLAVKKELAQQYQLRNLSDLSRIANTLKLAVPAEFLKRSDGLPGLTRTYNFHFQKIVQMQPNLVYQAIKNDAVQAIEAYTTDGKISEFQLSILNDDKHFYPPYDAAPIIRNSILKNNPQVLLVLAPLLGTLDNKTMQHLNYLIDVKKIPPQKVAHDFLVSRNLI